MDHVAPSIAVVDDEEPVRKALKRLLQSSGMAAEAFASGSTFLGTLDVTAWDCLVLDLHMPDTTGFDVLAWLSVSGTRVPVVVMTGHHTPEAREQALAAGAIAYLLKPVDERALLAAIALAVPSIRP